MSYCFIDSEPFFNFFSLFSPFNQEYLKIVFENDKQYKKLTIKWRCSQSVCSSNDVKNN